MGGRIVLTFGCVGVRQNFLIEFQLFD